jgi:hypothetical protein
MIAKSLDWGHPAEAVLQAALRQRTARSAAAAVECAAPLLAAVADALVMGSKPQRQDNKANRSMTQPRQPYQRSRQAAAAAVSFT